MSAIVNALQNIEQNKLKKVIVCSDSMSASVSLQSMSSQKRPDILYEIYESLYRRHHAEREIRVMCNPAQKSIKGN